jgi:hypothetical protein
MNSCSDTFIYPEGRCTLHYRWQEVKGLKSVVNSMDVFSCNLPEAGRSALQYRRRDRKGLMFCCCGSLTNGRVFLLLTRGQIRPTV